MIRINIQNKGNITVFENNDVILKMIRKTPIPFLKTIGEIFQNENKLAVINFHFLKGKKIIFQDFTFTLEILRQKVFSSIFCINKDIIKINHNPFFLFNKNFCTVYYNSELVIEISMKSVIEVSGYNLELKFFTENELIKQASLMSFIIYSIEYNLS
jgi:hypothetical protein